MKEVTIKVYEFKELSEPVQEKLRRGAIDVMIDTNFEAFNELAVDTLLSEYGIKGEVYYSLRYQQGDGLHFETNNLLTDKVLSIIGKQLSPNAAILALWLKENNYTTLCSRHRGMCAVYEYATARDVVWSDTKYIEASEELESSFREDHPDILIATKYFEELRNAVKELYLQICSKLEKMGYNCYEISDEEINDYFAGEYYYKEGALYREEN